MISNISNTYYLIKDNIKEAFSNKVNIILINPVILLCQCVHGNKVSVTIYNSSKIKLYDAVLYECSDSFIEGSIIINGKSYKLLNLKKGIKLNQIKKEEIIKIDYVIKDSNYTKIMLSYVAYINNKKNKFYLIAK